MLLEGIFLPLTTPFFADGRLNLAKLEANVSRYTRTSAAGMMIGGPNSEADGLDVAELIEVLGCAVKAASADKVMIAGATRGSVSGSVTLAEAAARMGYDVVAVRGPEFAGDVRMQVETRASLEAIADRSPLPVLLISDPARPLSVELVQTLAGHGNVVGLLDGSDDRERVAAIVQATGKEMREVMVTPVFAAVTGRMLAASRQPAGDMVAAASLTGGGTAVLAAPTLKTRTRRVGFQVLTAYGEAMLACWGAGAVGGVPRLAACAPQGCCEVWQAYRDGDLPLAERKQARIVAASHLVEGPRGVALAKSGCDWNGYFGGRPRLPVLPADEAGRKALVAALGGLKH